MSVFARFTLLVVLVPATLLFGQNQQPHTSQPEQALPPAQEKPDLSDQVVRDVFTPMQQGMEGHNLTQVLATFDDDKMSDYAHVRDHLRALFDQYDSMRFRYQLLQVTSDKTGASAVAEIEMEATPADESQGGLQRGTQMRFRLVHGPKGWKLAGFSPANFFD